MKNIILYSQCKSKADFFSFFEILFGIRAQGRCRLFPAERERGEEKSSWGGNKEPPELFLKEEERTNVVSLLLTIERQIPTTKEAPCGLGINKEEKEWQDLVWRGRQGKDCLLPQC